MYFHVFFNIIRHDLIIAYRRRGDWINTWLFFVIVVSLFPLAITPDRDLLHTIAPGLIWVAALLSMLIALSHFLRPDNEDGSLLLLLLSPYPLSWLLFAKMIAFWLVSAFPLMMITPLLALMLHLSFLETGVLMLTLLIGTPVFIGIGGVGMALTIGLRQQNVLLALLILPLCIPVLIFGTGAVINLELGSSQGALALLSAMFMLTMPLAPVAAAMALKSGTLD